jgi:predicted nucleic acid-binding protein
MNILVDTCVWSAALRTDSAGIGREVDRLRIALQGEDGIFTTGLILQELLQGFSAPKSRDRILETFAALPLIIPERQDHVDAAALRIQLRKKGVQAGTIDVLLARLCLRHGLSILTSDTDFVHMARFVPLRLA